MIPDGSSDPETLTEVLDIFIRHAMERAHHCMIGQVNDWIPERQVLEIQPLLREISIEDGEVVKSSFPPLVEVPVMFTRLGGFVVRMPIKKGDRVVVLFTDRQLDEWLSGDGSQIDPESRRAHSLDDAIALPLSPTVWTEPLPNVGDGDLLIGREDGGGGLRIKENGAVELGSDSATKRGIARLNDQTKSTIVEDQAMWGAFMPALRTLLTKMAQTPLFLPVKPELEAAAAAVPTELNGKIASSSSKVSSE